MKIVSFLALFVLASCNLTPAQIGGLIREGVSLACTTAESFSPPKAKAIEAIVCTDALIAAPAIQAAIEAAAAAAEAGAATSTPREALLPATTPSEPPKALRCAGKAVAVVPAALAPRAQAQMDARPECAR